MYKAKKLLQIGAKVFVNVGRVKDRISTTLITLLKDDPYGKLIGYKMTDGQDVGYILELSDGSTSWFFSNEVEDPEEESLNNSSTDKLELARNPNKIELLDKNKEKEHLPKIHRRPEIGQNIFELLNPINFIRWLLYSLKDVF